MRRAAVASAFKLAPLRDDRPPAEASIDQLSYACVEMRNWAGNLEYHARQVLRPTSVEELQDVVRSSSRIRPIGSRHSFNELADTTGDHVILSELPRILDIDVAGGTATIDGGARYGDVCAPLDAAGLALDSLASLPHISVTGACATGTHGSGDRTGSLATAVQALDIILADGELVTARDDDPPAEGQIPLAAAVVNLGAIGVVSGITLKAEPRFDMRQDVFEGLPIDAFVDHFDEITALAESVSFFTVWDDRAFHQLWLKTRLEPSVGDGLASGGSGGIPTEVFGARPATVQRHPIPGMSPDACTAQLGVRGSWHERLPHFRLDHTPSAGDELQSEYLVPRERAVDAFLAIHRLRRRIAPLIQVSEVRTVAADHLWLSPMFERDSVAFHFTWLPDWAGVKALLPVIEAALRPFEPRPHWAKLFTMERPEVRSRYPQLGTFASLATELDPTGKLRNAFLGRYLFA